MGLCSPPRAPHQAPGCQPPSCMSCMSHTHGHRPRSCTVGPCGALHAQCVGKGATSQAYVTGLQIQAQLGGDPGLLLLSFYSERESILDPGILPKRVQGVDGRCWCLRSSEHWRPYVQGSRTLRGVSPTLRRTLGAMRKRIPSAFTNGSGRGLGPGEMLPMAGKCSSQGQGLPTTLHFGLNGNQRPEVNTAPLFLLDSRGLAWTCVITVTL